MPIYEHEPLTYSSNGETVTAPRSIIYEREWFTGCTQPRQYTDADGTECIGMSVKLAKRVEDRLVITDHRDGSQQIMTDAEFAKLEDRDEMMQRAKVGPGGRKGKVSERSRYTWKRVRVEVEGGEFFYRYKSEQAARLDAVTLYRMAGKVAPEWTQPKVAEVVGA